ncbi:unnamed protein product [Rhodiola kirilowii]
MEYQSFINQWTVNSYEGHVGATIMPMAEEAGFPYDDHYLHHLQQLPIKATTTTVDDFHNRPEKHLKANSSYESACIIPRPEEPCNNFSTSGSTVAASIFYPANPTGMAVIKPKQDINDYAGRHVAPKFTVLDGLPYPVWNNNDQITYDMEDSGTGEKRKVISVMSAAATRSSAAQDHVIAERKRREKLSQRFIALSAVVPGLKKTDKASVLAGAVKYLKKLQERVKILEDQTKSKTVESVVLKKRSQQLVIIDGKNKPSTTFSNETSIEGGLDDDRQELPEIEARVCNKDVLIRVHCDNKKGVIEKILGEMSKLHFMSVVNTNVLAFGSLAFDVTIVAQMDAECCMTVKEIAKTLRAAFVGFM